MDKLDIVLAALTSGAVIYGAVALITWIFGEDEDE